jgi:hypothetical protein
MHRVTVDKLYQKTLGLSDGLDNDLDKAGPGNRFKVLQKHIRFHILDILVRRKQNMDLKHYILRNHHEGEQLSQRDITSSLKRMVDGLDDNEKLLIIREAFDEVWRILREICVVDNRDRAQSALGELDYVSEREKRNLLDKAIGDDGETVFFERLKTFDHKTIANFIAVFGLSVRQEDEKNNSRSTKEKLSKYRGRQNDKMWANPKIRRKLCMGMERSWRVRKIEALYPE